MADLLQTTGAWLEGKRTAYLARTVTYRRGASSVEIAATVGRRRDEVDRDSGINLEFETIDFIVNTADLILASALTEPMPGDEIDDVAAGITYTYEVCPLLDEPPWRFSDAGHVAMRIHTKLLTQGATP